MFIIMWKNLIVLTFLTVLHFTASNQPCLVKEYSKGYTVCVCNSSYCDTISPIEKLKPGKYIAYTSNKAGLRFHESRGNMKLLGRRKNTIKFGKKQYQKMLGFGGAFTDSAGINIASLEEAAQNNLLKSYFSDTGLEYNFGRVPIGASDFSTHPYTYDDTSFEDPDLKHFNLTDEDYNYKIPLIKKANELSKNKLRLIAVPWTSPNWMKIIPKYASFFSELKKSMYQPWADYQLKFLEAYDANNVSFWGISTGNEPTVGYFPFGIPVVAFTPWELAKWIANHFGPTIRKSKFSNIKIITLDDERPFVPLYIGLMFLNKKVDDYVDGIGIHWYFDKVTPPFLLDITHDWHPSKFLLITEACRGNVPLLDRHIEMGSWPRAEDVARGMIENMKHWVTGWIDWNLALDTKGGPNYSSNFVDSPIIVNASAGEFYKQPMFYAIGHFSKFVPVGSKRIDVSDFDRDVETIGFKRPDGGFVVIVLNRKNKKIDVTIVENSRGQIPLRLTPNSLTSVIFW